MLNHNSMCNCGKSVSLILVRYTSMLLHVNNQLMSATKPSSNIWSVFLNVGICKTSLFSLPSCFLFYFEIPSRLPLTYVFVPFLICITCVSSLYKSSLSPFVCSLFLPLLLVHVCAFVFLLLCQAMSMFFPQSWLSSDKLTFNYGNTCLMGCTSISPCFQTSPHYLTI